MKKPIKKSKLEKKSVSLEEAKSVLKNSEKIKIETASKKLADFIKAWEIETNCRIVISGQFHGTQVQSGIQVVVNNI